MTGKPSKPANEIIEKKSGNVSIALPCEPEDLKNFISGLLGKPQIIQKFFDFPFEVRKSDISDIFHLLDQRIHQQNKATLLQFTVKILYDDDSSVTINSIEEFMIYNEVRPLESREVTISWVYLIRFQQKDIPERQQIDLTYRAGRGKLVTIEDGFGIHRLKQILGPATINLRIAHTDRTWGIDIESLISGQLKNLKISQNKVYSKFTIVSVSVSSTLTNLEFKNRLYRRYIQS